MKIKFENLIVCSNLTNFNNQHDDVPYAKLSKKCRIKFACKGDFIFKKIDFEYPSLKVEE